jgi:hypothetical protein
LPGGNNHHPTKLHGFWDNDAVSAQFPPLPAGLSKKEQTARNEGPQKQLVQRLATEEPKNWRLPASVKLDDYAEAWANEILPIAREAHERLRFSNVHAGEDKGRTVAQGSASEQPMSDHLSYRDWSARVVHHELHEAGWRLADLLKKTLASNDNAVVVASSSPAAATNSQVESSSVPPSPSPTLTPARPTPARSPTLDPIYGEYPVKYKDIIMDWLYVHLHDPLSARIEWQTEPKRADLPGPRGRKLYGYLVLFTINAKNQFGTYTGKQAHGALIRNGEVIKTLGFGY